MGHPPIAQSLNRAVSGRRSLILASASPRRRQLLRHAGIPFRVVPSHIPETSRYRDPVGIVKDLAARKAMAIARALETGIVLGADTVVVLKGKILGKPRGRRDACRMLGHLAGTSHKVYTGVALVNAATGRKAVSYAVSTVKMKRIPPEKLLQFSSRHLDKAGAYAIQERKDPIAKVVKGSYDNVVGLPVGLVKELFKRLLMMSPRRRVSRGPR